MTAAIQLVFFLRMLAVGVFVPVLSLALLAHGATIGTISLLLGVHSTAAVAAEFPSGVLADWIGQKRVFLISALLSVACFVLVLFSRSLWLLLPAMSLMGLSRAFASGTLDALAVNQTAERGDAALLGIASRFSVLESAGLALGALAGGALASAASRYAANIAVCIGLYALVFGIAVFGIRERHTRRASAHTGRRIGGQLRQSVTFVRQKGVVRTLLVMTVATGFAMIAVETYWQPAYSAFASPAWTLGLVSFGSFFFVLLGSRLIAVFLKRRHSSVLTAYLTQRAVFGAGLVALYFTASAGPFIALYMLSYFFLGGGGVAETTLIHQAASDDQRSSILSLFSLVAQVGCVLASVAGFAVSANTRFQLMWLIAGMLLLLCAATRALRRN